MSLGRAQVLDGPLPALVLPVLRLLLLPPLPWAVPPDVLPVSLLLEPLPPLVLLVTPDASGCSSKDCQGGGVSGCALGGGLAAIPLLLAVAEVAPDMAAELLQLL